MTRPHRSLTLVGVAVTGALGAFIAARPAFDRSAWLADYFTLRTAMEQRYANLAALSSTGRVDLSSLHARTDSALRAARSDGEARGAMRHFVSAFHDGHLRLVSREAPAFVRWTQDRWSSWRSGSPDRDWPAERACDAFGYAERHGDFSVPLDRLGSVRPVAREGSFRAAVVTLVDGRRVGVVRIPLLSQRAYRTECEAAWNAIRASSNARCTDCEDRLYQETGDRLLATLGDRLRALRSAGAEALVVDLGGNGGGSEWAEDAARVLTRGDVRSARAALVRGDASAGILADQLAQLDSALASPGLSPRARVAVDSARARYVMVREEARRTCDFSDVWTRSAAAATCTNLVPALTYTTGAYEFLEAGALGDSAVESLLHTPTRTSRYAGAWEGPLVLLVDGRTASAAEEVVAALRDSRLAVVVGAPTLGAGCGFVGRVDPVVLPHSRLKVMMPNCVRLRADGSNEVLGIRPDVRVPWTDADDDAERARKLAPALSRALSPVSRW